MSTIEPFRIDVGDDVISDLGARLGATRWPQTLPDAGWDYGTDIDWLRELCTYWHRDYSWSAQQQLLNQLPQVMVDCGGMQVHAVHAPGVGPDPLPLVLTHGWPSTFFEMHKVYPDMFDGETYEGLEWLTQVIQKVGTADDVEKVIEAWEDSKYDGLEGPFFMRKCDHQAVQPGFVVEAVKDPAYSHLIPKILATYPGDKVTPKCRTEDFA